VRVRATQLGYIVSSGVRSAEGVRSLVLLVQARRAARLRF